LRKSNGTDLPRVYEQTWAFQNRNGLGRFKVPLHMLWSALGLAIRLNGDVFVEEQPTEGILGRRLVIWARK
jgi:hypothetical protein